jgi:acyl-CoA synthetase (AMP-forming)/AMP-acid ligase II
MALPATDFLSGYAAAHPDKLGVVEGDRVLDYAELNRESNRAAAVLIDLGVRAGTKLVWCGQNGIEVVVLVSAARKAGAVAVPLNYRLAPEEAAYVIDNSDATVVLFDVEQTEQLDEARVTAPRCSTGRRSGAARRKCRRGRSTSSHWPRRRATPTCPRWASPTLPAAR